MKEAEKEKKRADSQSVAEYTTPSSASGKAPTASDASTAASTVDNVREMALGSLSTHDPGAAREQSTRDESTKRKGALSSLIYGTHEGQQMDQDIEKSFSQVLARGKYVHSIVFHSVKPDKVDEYVELVGNWYPRVAKLQGNNVNLVGSWRTEVGDCDTFGMSFHLDFFVICSWSFQSIFGNTNVTKAIITRYIQYKTTQTLQASTRSSRL